jgi:pyruvate kinase
MRQTKIVATISDQRCEKEFIQSLFDAGMNVARLNTAHITPESGRKMIENIRSVSNSIAILIDTKGPEIRTCKLQNTTEVSKGQIITISFKPCQSNWMNICVTYPNIVDDLRKETAF